MLFRYTIGQGYVFKIFESYNQDNDLVIWLYESLKDKNIQVAFSNNSNIDEYNNWIDKKKVNFKFYPIVTNIKTEVIKDVYDIVNNYYGLNEEIEMSKEFVI